MANFKASIRMKIITKFKRDETETEHSKIFLEKLESYLGIVLFHLILSPYTYSSKQMIKYFIWKSIKFLSDLQYSVI